MRPIPYAESNQPRKKYSHHAFDNFHMHNILLAAAKSNQNPAKIVAVMSAKQEAALLHLTAIVKASPLESCAFLRIHSVK
jgi:hypothetical protein